MEPQNVSKAIAEMELDYVVITSVNRDDLPDQGSNHFAACIQQIRKNAPGTMTEVLIPDFGGDLSLLTPIDVANPNVIAHNIECVRRLTPKVRDPRAGYDQSLSVLLRLHEMRPDRPTKSSIMVGVGETTDEVVEAMADLRTVGVNFLTIGQYLQPSKRHMNLVEYITPEIFEHYRQIGEALGFAYVASGPLVRSSYKAGEFFIRQYLKNQKIKPIQEASL